MEIVSGGDDAYFAFLDELSKDGLRMRYAVCFETGVFENGIIKRIAGPICARFHCGTNGLRNGRQMPGQLAAIKGRFHGAAVFVTEDDDE